MSDPFDVLHRPVIPLAPRAEFVLDPRRRVEQALRPAPASGQRPAGHTPARLHSITPYLCVHDTRAALEWYGSVFGGETLSEIVVMDDGRVGHAEVRIGDSVIMLADEFPEIGVLSPLTRGGSPISLNLYVPDVDRVFALAVESGATVERPVADQFHGARMGWLIDPFGHRWSVGTQIAQPADAATPATPSSTDASAIAPAGDATGVSLGYFTLGVPDGQRARRFYSALFDWLIEPGGPDGGGHIANVDPPAGLMGDVEAPTITLYFRVPDVRPYAARVVELGGEASEPVRYPSGWNVECRDDQGTRFDLWQPAEGY